MAAVEKVKRGLQVDRAETIKHITREKDGVVGDLASEAPQAQSVYAVGWRVAVLEDGICSSCPVRPTRRRCSSRWCA